MTIDLAVLILTHNEEKHIARALRSVRGLAREIFVIDSFSKDRTADLAEGAGATVLRHAFVNYAQQFEWGMSHAPITSTWVMRLDADEILSASLITEIKERLPSLPSDICGVNLRRSHVFMGRELRHGGRYPLTLLRLWRRGDARIESRWMDEHMVLTRGRSVTFAHDFTDYNLNDLSFFTDKHNKYATREAVDVLLDRYGLGTHNELTWASGTTQAAWKRWMKREVYNRLPMPLGPLLYFLFRYFLQLGFLDGREGLIYHVLQGFWYRFLVAAKVDELDRALAPCRDDAARLGELARLTGFAVDMLKQRSQADPACSSQA
jgi:glycosyltransferase involved in cell wall biosynthesis